MIIRDPRIPRGVMGALRLAGALTQALTRNSLVIPGLLGVGIAAVAQGNPSGIVTAKLVEDVVGLPCRVVPDPEAGTPLVVPLKRQRVPAVDSAPVHWRGAFPITERSSG